MATDNAMTVADLIKLLRTLPKGLPVQMHSDAEGNDLHELAEVSFDGPDDDVTHATAIILVPKHGSVGEGW